MNTKYWYYATLNKHACMYNRYIIYKYRNNIYDNNNDFRIVLYNNYFY